MCIREFRFEEFVLMEDWLQLSFHTIALKMDFLTSFNTTTTSLTWMGRYNDQNTDLSLLSLHYLGHSFYITVPDNFRNIKILKVLHD